MLPYVKTSVVRQLLGKPGTTFYEMLDAGEIPDEVARIKRGAHTEWCVESVWYWLHHRQDPTGADDIEALLAFVDKHPLPEWVVEIASRHTLVEAGR